LAVTPDIFAGVAVSDYVVALGCTSDYSAPRPPSSEPIEAVWEVTEHGYVYIEV
jgi:hypothetical protein